MSFFRTSPADDGHVRGISGSSGGDRGERYGVGDLIFEIGHLKRTGRTGWSLLGVSNPESVAEHSHRTAAIAYMLAAASGANADRAASLAVFHDLAEARTMDIASVGKRYLHKVDDVDVVAHQVAGVNDEISERLLGLIREYVAQETEEAKIAHDADKLECLAQAMEYSEQGYSQSELWKKGSMDSLVLDKARAFGDELLRTFPGKWWSGFVERYRSSGGSQ